MTASKIVVLDGYTLNPGDLSWSELEALGPCTIHDRTAPDEVLSRIGEAEVVLTNKCKLTAETIQAAPRLRYIGVLATGYNIVDFVAAGACHVLVTNIPAYGTAAVAQHVFALLLELTQHVGRHAQSVRAGDWTRSPDWCYWQTDLLELSGLRLGLLGAGRIAQATAAIGRAFGMEVQFAKRAGGRPQFEAMLRTSDVVSLHCPLTPETKEIINERALQMMKSTAFLINTSRGPLIHETDLAQALNEGRIAGAGLDVLSTEPPPADHPLLTTRNCLITPHLAWAARASRARLLEIAVGNIRAFFEGRPRNVIPELGESGSA